MKISLKKGEGLKKCIKRTTANIGLELIQLANVNCYNDNMEIKADIPPINYLISLLYKQTNKQTNSSSYIKAGKNKSQRS